MSINKNKSEDKISEYYHISREDWSMELWKIKQKKMRDGVLK